MVKETKKRIPVTLDKETYSYLEKIVQVVNNQLNNENYRLSKKMYKISVSKLFYLAIGNLIIRIDKCFDESLPAEENYKKVTKLLVPYYKKK